MTSTEAIERNLREKVAVQIRLASEGAECFRVFTPFQFEDGDHLSIVLRKDGARWRLSDEAHTLMRMTYDIEERDLRSGTRQKLISNALSVFQVEERDGELTLDVQDENYGDALYSFVQALLRISDVSYLSRERTRSTFMEDFRALLTEVTSHERRCFDWSDPERDPDRKYVVDCRINGLPRPLFVHALAGDGRTRDATIALHQFKKWGLLFRSLAIFEDQESISPKVLARFSDICEEECFSLAPNRERLERHLRESVSE